MRPVTMRRIITDVLWLIFFVGVFVRALLVEVAPFWLVVPTVGLVASVVLFVWDILLLRRARSASTITTEGTT